LCIKANETCCTSAEGGGWCPLEAPQCCPPTTQFPRGSCCLDGQTCCNTVAECETGQTCDAGCCVTPPLLAAGQSGHERQDGASRAKP
jgi:hypothetical protein